MNGRISITCLACSLLLAICGLASAGPIPIIVPGMPMPDGNGQVKGARAYAQLPDGRLIVAVDISRAWSPTTGLPLMTNYGAYNYSFTTEQMVREFRHDYPEDQGGAPGIIGFYSENFSGLPLVLDNGDRIYRGEKTLYRYSDEAGLVGHGGYFSRYCVAGRNGYIGAPSWTRDRYYSLSREGTDLLLTNGQTFPGIPKTVQSFYAKLVCPDGSHLVRLSEHNWSGNHTVRVKAGEPYNVNDIVYSTAVCHGDTAIAFVGGEISIQSQIHQPRQVTLAYGGSFRGDHRVNMGGGPTTQWYTPVRLGFVEGGFVTERVVYDSRTDTELGRGMCFFDVNGALVSSLLPEDPNPFGSGAFQSLSQAKVQYRDAKYYYQNEFGMAFEVTIDNGDGTTRRAWWRMNRNGDLEQAFVVGQTVTGFPSYTITAGDMPGDLTFDGRSIYTVVGKDASGQERRWTACYTPGVGLIYDMVGTHTPVVTGPDGARVYCADGEAWKMSDGTGTQLLATKGEIMENGEYEVRETTVCGLTPEENVVLRLTLQDTSTGSESKDVYYLHDGQDLIKLVDLSQPFDGKELNPYYYPNFEHDTNNWIFVTPDGMPLVRIQFEDGTSGLYAVPEPGTVLLLALGGVTMLFRRRSTRLKARSNSAAHEG